MPPKKSKVVKPAVVEVPVEVPVIEVPVIEVAVIEPIVEKKRSKKAPKIVATVTPEGITGNFQGEVRRPLIAHLQVNSSTVNFTNFPISYDPNPPAQPEPYEPGFDNYFSNQNEALLLQGQIQSQVQGQVQGQVQVNTEDVTKTTTSVAIIVKNENDPLPCFKKYDLMVQYRDTQTSMKLPIKTDVACFWCAHTFVNQPCILPEREEKGTYHVYGNFCCPECAVSYLLEESLDATTRWERMALLNRIYGAACKHARIFPAPSRSSLKLFGGPMTIEAFRKTVLQGKVRIDIQMPPMVSILGSLDTKPIDFYDSSLKNTVSPLLQETVSKAEEGLRLKRNKPLKDRESTLDSVMNIQIRPNGRKN
jgi:hypothetical protein